MGTGSFLGVKCGRGLLLISHPPSSAEVLEEFSYTSTPLWAVRPVQSLSRAITLLPLWTVRSVQRLSKLHLYYPYGPYGLYRASVSYTSTPPMGRTACTEPH